MRKTISLLFLFFVLLGCQSDNNINDEYADLALETAEMLKTVYESSDKSLSDYERDKYIEFLEVGKVDGREKTTEESVVLEKVMYLGDYVDDTYNGDKTFDEIYNSLMDDLK